jgi:hypothetical protein
MVVVNGKPMTRAGVRDVERQKLLIEREKADIMLSKQRDVAAAEVAAAEAIAEKARLELADVQAVHDAKRAVVTKSETTESERKKSKERVKRSRRNNVGMVVALCAAIEFAGQVIFFFGYLDNWPQQLLPLLFLAPFIVPIFTWGFGRDAYLRAKDKVPYAKSMMVMWISAFAAAAMITFELTLILRIPGLPEFFGAASIAGPAMFHWHVGSVSQDAHEISAIDRAKMIARKWANRLRHPFIWWGAVDLYHSSVGVIDYEHAWLMVYRQKKGHLPGMLPVYVPDVQVRRLRWLRKLLDRLVFATSNGVSNGRVSNGASNATPGRHAIEAPATSNAVAPGVAQEALLPAVEQRPVVAPPESDAEITAPMSPLLDEVSAWLEGKGTGVAHADVAAGLREVTALLETRNPRSQGVAQQATSNGVSNDAPASNGVSNGSTSNDMSNTKAESNVRRLLRRRPEQRSSNAPASNVPASQLVREWMDKKIASNVPLDQIFGSDAMAAVNPLLVKAGREEVTRQAADNAVRNYRKQLQKKQRREA